MDDFLAEDVDIDDLLDGDDEEDVIQSPTPGSKIQLPEEKQIEIEEADTLPPTPIVKPNSDDMEDKTEAAEEAAQTEPTEDAMEVDAPYYKTPDSVPEETADTNEKAEKTENSHKAANMEAAINDTEKRSPADSSSLPNEEVGIDGIQDEINKEDEKSVVVSSGSEVDSTPKGTEEPIQEGIKDELCGLDEETFDFQNEDNDILDDDEEEKAYEEKFKVPGCYPPIQEEKKSIFMSEEAEVEVNRGRVLEKNLIYPVSEAALGIAEITEEEAEKIRIQLEAREEHQNQEGLKVGLGLKKKEKDRMGRMNPGAVYVSAKAKTLAEKRAKLQEDMLKFGVAAIERLYPRQPKKTSPGKKTTRPKMSPFKMKASNCSFKFEEVDARSIIRPFSHHKYIQEPTKDTVVFVNRRDGLVPLETLSKSRSSINSTKNVSLVSERNQALGKPLCFIRDSNRLLAVGGSRNREHSEIKIVKVPSFSREKNRLPLFEVDLEMANFAASALGGHDKRVDIRKLKKAATEQQDTLAKKILQEKSLLDRMLLKINLRDKESEIPTPFDVNEAGDVKTPAVEVESKETTLKSESSLDSTQDSQEEESESESAAAMLVVKNSWKKVADQAFPAELNMDECPPLRGYTESSIKPILKTPLLTADGYTGWDVCDVDGCFCKQESPVVSGNVSPSETPVTGVNSGNTTPNSGKGNKKKIAKDLLRVKRALKTLGVNIIEFDDQESGDASCNREYCKFGCVCESIKMKPQPPVHCGKNECMFDCSCSQESLKFSSCGNRRVNISAAVGARIQEDSQRFMAAEEKKFNTTVVLTADRETVMLGGRGTKRERKIPQRYQNSLDGGVEPSRQDSGAKKEGSGGEAEDEEEAAENDPLEDSFFDIRREMDITPCTVIIPKVVLPKSTEVWCMYHARYSCPCAVYKNPLDFGPDVSQSKNKARRSLGAKFVTKRKRSPEPPIEASKPDVEMVDIDELLSDQDDEKENDEDTSTVASQDELQEKDVGSAAGECSRTMGHPVKQSRSVKQPFKPPPPPEEKSPFKEVASTSTAASPVQNFLSKTLHKHINATTSGGTGSRSATDMTKFSLKIAARHTFQYARWDVLKEKFINGDIDIFFHVRPGRGTNLLFLVEKGQKSYIASAVNLRYLEGASGTLPALAAACLEPLNSELDKNSYAVLESNGFVWTFQSLLSSNKVKSSGMKRKKIKHLTPSDAKKPKLQDKFELDIDSVSKKLPAGQSMVTVTKEGKPLMQVKLPSTSPSQNWTLISVESGQPTIQCPDSTLVLKCAILVQAANLACATKTTVRIPITVAGQEKSFGVYAVPGLKSHVFVGPFHIKEDDNDVMLLEEEEDEVQEVEMMKVEDLENAVKQKFSNQVKLLGQMPQTVSRSDKDDEVEIIEETPEKTSQAQKLKEITEEEVKALKDQEIPVQFSFGRVVKRLTGLNPPLDYSKRTEVIINGKVHTVFEVSGGKMRFAHPDNKNFDVCCLSLVCAKLWLKKFYSQEEKTKAAKSKSPKAEEENRTNDSSSKTSVSNKESEVMTKECNNVITKDLKEMGDKLMADSNSKQNQPKQSAEKKDLPRLVRVQPAGSNGKQAAYGVLIKSRQEKEESRLFYDLGRTALRQCFTKNTTKDQILKLAKNEIESLKFEGNKLENQKQTLMRQRAKLFDDFTNGLDGLTIKQKKDAVANLKRLLSSKEPAVPLVSPESAKKSKKVQISVNKVKDFSSTLTATGQPTPYTDVTGIKTVRKDGTIIKPLNAYSLWANEKKCEFLEMGIPQNQLQQYLSKTWSNLSDKAKIRYFKEAKHLKILHSIQHPNFYSESERRVLKSLQAEAKAVAEEAARLQPPSTSKAMTQQLQVAAPAISQQPAAATSAMASQTGSAAASTNSDDRVPNTESAAATEPVSVSCRTTTAVDQGVQSPAVVQGVQSAAVEQGVQTVTAAATVQPVTIQSSPAQTKLPEEGLNSAIQTIKIGQSILSKAPSPQTSQLETGRQASMAARPGPPSASAPLTISSSTITLPSKQQPSLKPTQQKAPTATAAVQNQPVQRRASIEIQSASSSQIFGGNNSVVQEQAFKAPIQITNVISQAPTEASAGISPSQQLTGQAGTLDLSEIPSDAADVLGLALQSSGIQDVSNESAVTHEEWSQEQYKPVYVQSNPPLPPPQQLQVQQNQFIQPVGSDGLQIIHQRQSAQLRRAVQQQQQQVRIQQRAQQQQLLLQQQQQHQQQQQQKARQQQQRKLQQQQKRRQLMEQQKQQMQLQRQLQQQQQQQKQQQQIVYLNEDGVQQVAATSGGDEVIHVSGESLVMDQSGRQIILGSSFSGEQIILESDQSAPQYYLQDDGQQVYVQPEVYLQPEQVQNELHVQSEPTESQVYVEASGGPQEETGEVFLQTSESGEQVYVDEHGRQVIFQEAGAAAPAAGQPQYYMQDGQLFQIVGDDVTQID